MARNNSQHSLDNIKRMVSISDKYFECCNKLRNEKQNIKWIIHNVNSDLNLALHFKFLIESIFEVLDPVAKLIINNDFFHQNYRGWWQHIYSKSSYYRLRSSAIKTFLELTDDPTFGKTLKGPYTFE